MIQLFILALAARRARVLTGRFQGESSSWIASGMGGCGATRFGGILSGAGRGTALAVAEVEFLPGGPSERRAGLETLSSFLPSTSMGVKGVSASRRTRVEKAVRMRLFWGQESHIVPFSSIHIYLSQRCDGVSWAQLPRAGIRAVDGGPESVLATAGEEVETVGRWQGGVGDARATHALHASPPSAPKVAPAAQGREGCCCLRARFFALSGTTRIFGPGLIEKREFFSRTSAKKTRVLQIISIGGSYAPGEPQCVWHRDPWGGAILIEKARRVWDTIASALATQGDASDA